MLDYGMYPPEVNSARIYAGPGPASMLTAAANWDGLAADLRSEAANYALVVSGLTSQAWRGPASISMAAAAAPYVAWMDRTAAQAEQTAVQAKAAAEAYENAFSMTVPPPVIATNRAELATLVATNILGQNTPAIAANEGDYAGMWAQDVSAMYGYAGQSAVAARLTPFAAPTQTTNSGAVTTQSAAVTAATGNSAGTGVQSSSTVLTTLQSLASGGSTTSTSSDTSTLLSDLFSSDGAGLNSNFWNTITSTGAFNPAEIAQAVTGSTFLGAGMGGLQDLAPSEMAAGLGSGGMGLPAASGFSSLGAGEGISAGIGKAATMGPLSVPPAWTSIATPNSPLASALGATPLNAPGAAAPGMPGMPIPTGPSVNTADAATPKYGFRPTIVQRPPMAG